MDKIGRGSGKSMSGVKRSTSVQLGDWLSLTAGFKRDTVPIPLVPFLQLGMYMYTIDRRFRASANHDLGSRSTSIQVS